MASASQQDTDRAMRTSNIILPTREQVQSRFARSKDVGSENIIETKMGYIIIVNKILFWFNIFMFIALIGGFCYLSYVVYKFYKDWENGKGSDHPDTQNNKQFYYGYFGTIAIVGTIILTYFILLCYQIANRSRYSKSDDAILELSKNLTIQASINRAARNIKTIGGVQLDAERRDLDEDVYDTKNRSRRDEIAALKKGNAAYSGSETPGLTNSTSENYINPEYGQQSPLSLSKNYRKKKKTKKDNY